MKEPSSVASSLEILSSIFIRCFAIGYAVVLLWFFIFMLAGDAGYDISTKLFKITRHEYDLINYCGIAFAKVCNILFFLIPYIATRWVIMKQRKK
jgi:hypothetical protein